MANNTLLARTRRSVCLVVFCCLVAMLRLTAQEVAVWGDKHGVAPDQAHRTLVKIVLSEPLPPNAKQIRIRYSFPQDTKDKVTALYLLVSDSLAVRDLPDYKRRVSYDSFPISKEDCVMTLSADSVAGRRFFYLAADIGPVASFSRSDTLTALVQEVAVDGRPLPLKELLPASRRLYRGYEALFVPGDDGSRNYRIPAILKTAKGTLIAMADRRKYNQTDLPEDIDIVMRRSTDGGRSWSDPRIIVQGEGRNHGFGDVALVQTKAGKLLMIFVGGVGLWQSTPDRPQRTYVSESWDEGLTWSPPRDITHFIFGKDCADPGRSRWLASFCASGQGLVLPSGRIMFVAAIRESGQEYVLNNYVLYSDDEGTTWHLSDCAYHRGDEAKLTLMPDGRVLMSVRNQGRQESRQRFFALSSDDGLTWERAKQFEGIHDPGCNGAMLQVERSGRNQMLHSLPLGPDGRRDGAVYLFDHASGRWSAPVVVNSESSAYSDMTLLADGTIGYFVEEDDEISLVFIRFALDDLFDAGL